MTLIEPYTFEVLPQSWSKRRAMDKPSTKLVKFEVKGYESKDGHQCLMYVEFDNGDSFELTARVYVNKTHIIQSDGSIEAVDNSWGVQAISPTGLNVVLRLVK